MNPVRRAFALATRGDHARPGDGWQFVSIHASPGNLMRTTHPWSARTWDTVAELEAWVAAFERPHVAAAAKEGAKVVLAAREYHVVPLAIAIATPSRTLVVRTAAPREKSWRRDSAEEAGEYHLT